jgi:WD40 repeat protein
MAWSPDGRFMILRPANFSDTLGFPESERGLLNRSDHSVRTWDVERAQEAVHLAGDEIDVASAAYSPDGTRIVTGNHDLTVRVWDAASGAQLACLDGATCAAFSPDGARIVTGNHDLTIRVWDATSGAQLACLRGHEDRVSQVAFSADGRRVISMEDRGGVARTWDALYRVWDAHNGGCLEVVEGLTDVTALVSGPSGFLWRTLCKASEIVIECATTGRALTWFPATSDCIRTHPSGRTWAAGNVHHLYLFTLEGDPERVLRVQS